MSSTADIAIAYRTAIQARMKKMRTQLDLTKLADRKRYWKAHRRVRACVLPRGTNFVLKIEGSY